MDGRRIYYAAWFWQIPDGPDRDCPLAQ